MSLNFFFRKRFIVTAAAIGLGLATVAAPAFALTSIGTNISTDGTLTVAGNATFDTNTLFVDAANNRVGVGTTSPSAPLEVMNNSSSNAQIMALTKPQYGGGGVNDQGGYMVFRGGAVATPVIRGYFGFTQTTGGQGTILSGASADTMALRAEGDLLFGTGGDNRRLLITGAGNVGVNEMTPDAKLMVKGAGTTSATTSLKINSSGGTNLFAVRDDGSVGIGISSPAQKLEIATGNILVDRHPTSARSSYIGVGDINGSFSDSTAGSSIKIQSIADNGNSSQAMHFITHHSGVSAGIRMSIDKDGLVGIGISTPAGKLHVVTATSGSEIGLIVQNGVSTQTANLQEWRNSTGDVLAKVSAGGSIQAQTFRLLGSFDGNLANTSLTANRTWTFPDATGTVALTSDVSVKADKTVPATVGNFAALNASGNLIDSGRSSTDFVTPTGSGAGLTSLNASNIVQGSTSVGFYSAAGAAMNIDSGTTGNVTIGQGGSAKTITIGSQVHTLTLRGATTNIGTIGSAVEASTVNIANTSNGTGTQTVIIGSSAKAANSVVIAAGTTGNVSVSGTLAMGTNDIISTGSLGSSGSRLTKGWFTDIDVSNGVPVASGGTGATSASAALTNLLPSQTGNSGKFLGTNGSGASWVSSTVSVSGTAGDLVSINASGDLVDSGKASPSGAIVGTSDTQTLSNKTLTSPVVNQLNAAAGKVLGITSVGTPVNNLALSNAATGNSPSLFAEGSDTTVDLVLTPKGAGQVLVGASSVAGGLDAFSGQALTIGGKNASTLNLGGTSSGTINIGSDYATVLNFASTPTGSNPTGSTSTFNGKISANGYTAENTLGSMSTGLEIGSTFQKSNTTARQFSVAKIAPTFNFGVANTSTSVNVLEIDTTNTQTFGLSANLLKASYGGTQKMVLDSSGNLQVGGNVIVGNHLAATGTAVSSTATGTCTTAPTVSGNDVRGTVSGGTCTTGEAFTVTFQSTYSPAPVCVISPVNSTAASAPAIVVATGTNMTVTVQASVTSGTWNYICIQ